MKEDIISTLKDNAVEIRKLTIEMIGKLGVGHIGGSLSIADVLSVLYFDVMNIDPQRPDWPERDRFILSKGHGGPAVYATLALRGYIDKNELDTLNRSNTTLPSHCDMNLTCGIDMTTGSLGQGLSAAVGMALGAKIDMMAYKIYVIIGDGESQEGQIWEAAMLAGNKKLNNLIAFVDYNNMQIDNYVSEVNGLEPIDKKWESFGWHVQVINGNDVAEILDAVNNTEEVEDKPSMIILKTIKGKGAYFAENKVSSHNMPVTEEMWQKAVKQLSSGEVS